MKKRVLNMVAGVLLLGVALVGNALALDPPVLIDGVTASPSEIIPGEIISLTVAAPGYSDESLTYAWELERAPIEAVAVQIQEPNAKSTAVSGFTSTGSYTFEVTVTDDRGVSGREQVIVTVRDMSQPVVEITSPEEGDGIPADAEVTVSVYDDLDHTVIYDVKLDVYSGGSVLASSHSLSSGPYSFDLGADLTDEHGSQIVLSPGTYTVKAIATSEGMYGDDDVMVVVSDDYLRAPDITVLPSAVPSTMLVDETTTLNVVATHAEGAPIYTWSKADGPGEVTFSTNGTEQSGTTEATFSQVGEYVLDVVASYGTATNTRQLTVKVYDFVLDLRGTVVGPSSEISVDIIGPDDINSVSLDFIRLGDDRSTVGSGNKVVPSVFNLGSDLFRVVRSEDGSPARTEEHVTLLADIYTLRVSGRPSSDSGSQMGISRDITVFVPDRVGRVVPTITVQPSATPSTVAIDESTMLSVEATHPEGNCIYTWSQVIGPGEVTFTINGTEQSGTTEATFSQVGTYVLEVVAEYGGSKRASRVTVNVGQTQPLAIVIPALATPSGVVISQGTTLSVEATHPDGDYIYTWSKISGPGEVRFWPNSNETSKTTRAYLDEVGTYELEVSISNGGDSVTSKVSVTVRDPNQYEIVVDLENGAIVSPSEKISVRVDGPDDTYGRASLRLFSDDEHGYVSLVNNKGMQAPFVLNLGSDLFDEASGEKATLSPGTYNLLVCARPSGYFSPLDFLSKQLTITVEDLGNNTSGSSDSDEDDGCGIASTAEGSSSAMALVALLILGIAARRRQRMHS